MARKSLTPQDLNNNKIVNLADPTADQDAATKKYVDDNIGGGSSADVPYVDDTAPTSPEDGMLWWDTDDTSGEAAGDVSGPDASELYRIPMFSDTSGKSIVESPLVVNSIDDNGDGTTTYGMSIGNPTSGYDEPNFFFTVGNEWNELTDWYIGGPIRVNELQTSYNAKLGGFARGTWSYTNASSISVGNSGYFAMVDKSISALAGSLSINSSHTPDTNFEQRVMIRIKDNGDPRNITWSSDFRGIGLTLPTITTASKWMYIGMVYNQVDSKWDVIAVSQEA